MPKQTGLPLVLAQWLHRLTQSQHRTIVSVAKLKAINEVGCFFPAECPPPPRAKVQPKRGFVRPTQSHIGQCPSILVTTGSSLLVFWRSWA